MSRKTRILSDTAAKVLRLFVDEPHEELYGADIIAKAGIGSGSLYPILGRFATYGWLTSRWEDADPHAKGRPLLRLYRLSDTHAAEMNAALDEWCAAKAPKARRQVRPAARSVLS